MAQPRLDRELALQAVEALSLYGTQVAAAKALGIPRETFRSRLHVASRYGLNGFEPVPEGFEISHISSGPSGNYVKMRQEGAPAEKPEGLRLKGASILSRDGMEVIRWDKYGEDSALSNAAIVEAVRGAFADYEPPVATPEPVTDSDTMSVYPLADLHLGLMSWEDETGGNYDTNIARDTYAACYRRLIEATPASNHALILGLGDLLHADNYENRTDRSGNSLDVDSRYPKVLRESVKLIRYIIDLALTKHSSVEVRIMSGNHDTRSAIAVSLALSLGYEHDPRVKVDDSPNYIWFKRYGKVLLGATHGDKAKMSDMPLIMAQDRPHDWAESTRRRVFTGHIHHERLREIGGVVVESLRSPVARDAYHSFEGYRSGRSVYSYTFWTDGSRSAKVEFEI